MADTTERPWYGAAGMTRDELPAAVQAIRADVEGWLAQDGHADLRTWLLAAGETEPLGAPPASRSRAASARRAAAELAIEREPVAESAD